MLLFAVSPAPAADARTVEVVKTAFVEGDKYKYVTFHELVKELRAFQLKSSAIRARKVKNAKR